jgi:pentatricopeptide repeat protein
VSTTQLKRDLDPIETYGRAGDFYSACAVFEQVRKAGHELDDSSISGLMTAYMKKNQFDEAFELAS